MRRPLFAALCLLILCAAPLSAAEKVIEIKERVFVSLTNEIYLNAEDYIGKKIRLQGIFEKYTDDETGETFYSVTRRGPGCCGSDLNPGFEVKWDKPYPRPGVWVDATGVLELYEKEYLRLRLTELKVLPANVKLKLNVR
ncbi:TIGR03943 family putative permease subunit [Cloacibacillus porcorum]|uniref:TIGR03943 family putative permease subunit n=1 Tax=Cloacibacillus porcorum TaxID=1197717 RepID=UPI003F02C283